MVLQFNRWMGRTAVVVASLSFTGGCSQAPEPKHPGGGPFYSLDVDAKSTRPVKPIHDVSKTEAEKHDTYGIGYYDAQGRLTLYSQHRGGHEESFCRYFYDDKSVFEHEECRDTTGATTKTYYSADGALLRTESQPAPDKAALTR